MPRSGNERSRISENLKRYVRYQEGAAMYSMSQSKFEQLAKEWKCTYKVGKLVLVNTALFEQQLELYRDV